MVTNGFVLDIELVGGTIIEAELGQVYENNDISDNSFLEIYYFNVGQADSILLNNDDYTMLIDAGNNSDGDNINKFISELGIKDIDVIVGTHPHEDHIGGLDDIISNFDIGEIYLPDVTTTSKTFESLLDVIEEKNYEITIPKIDEEFNLKDMKFKVIYTGNSEDDLNNSSIVLKMEYGNTSYLFMGDAESKVEKLILDKDIKVDVLKVGHHGSNYSTSDIFLKKVNPRYAIISVGKDNKYKHPAEETLEKLKNIETYRTDIDGTIKLVSDGNNISIEKLDVSLDGN